MLFSARDRLICFALTLVTPVLPCAREPVAHLILFAIVHARRLACRTLAGLLRACDVAVLFAYARVAPVLSSARNLFAHFILFAILILAYRPVVISSTVRGGPINLIADVAPIGAFASATPLVPAAKEMVF